MKYALFFLCPKIKEEANLGDLGEQVGFCGELYKMNI